MDLANNSELLLFNSRALFRNLLLLVSTFYVSSKIRPFSKEFAESRSNTIGNIVDLFTNIINMILFVKVNYEKEYLQANLGKMVIKDQIMQIKLIYYAFILSSLSCIMLTLL